MEAIGTLGARSVPVGVLVCSIAAYVVATIALRRFEVGKRALK
jgi:hypothetical protein